MRVAINAAVIAHPLTGVARYAFELGGALTDLGLDVEYWTWDRFRDDLRASIGEGPVIRTFPHLKGMGTALVPGMKSLATRLDVYHFPNGDLLKCPVPKTAMIHDLAPFLFDGILPPDMRDFYREKTRRVVRLCAAVTVNSRTTLANLLELFPEGQDRYHLTPLGCDHILPPAGAPDALPCGLEPGYILSVGTIEPRKDYETLIRAWGLLSGPGRGEAPPLVIAGGDGFMAEETRMLARQTSPGGGVHFAGYVDESTLSTLYAHAALYVHSSIHEGFGLPVAEAMRWGLPVAAADNSAVRELFGGLYIPFDTGSPESAAAAISAALASRPDPELVESRSRVLEGLSWRNCAARTAEAFAAATGRPLR